MFSGIIKSTGIVQDIQLQGTTKRISIASAISKAFTIDQSVAHDGICLTVIDVVDGVHIVEVVAETLSKTTLHTIKKGHVLNLETAISANTLLDGHIVQGHIDTTITCTRKENKNGSWMFTFNLPEAYAALVISHGSICLNGVSLTVANLYPDGFDVAIIPYTFENTNFSFLKEGALANVEFDVIGKYLSRLVEVQQKGK